MNREARIWRRLALAGAGTVALLTARLLGAPPLRLPSLNHPLWRNPDLAGETRDEEIERRLRACETNLSNIWEHLNGRSADR